MIVIVIELCDFLLCFDFNLPHLPHFREDKIGQLRSVMDIECSHDPDRDYELTTDNVKKILAIHMRFRYVLVIISHFLFAFCGTKFSSSIHQVADKTPVNTTKPLHFPTLVRR